MAGARHLSNPPIQEALIDFQFAGAHLDRSRLQRLATELSHEGWQTAELNLLDVTIGPDEDDVGGTVGLQSSKTVFDGFAIHDSERHHFIQLRGARITVSTVNRYTRWEDLEDESSRVFEPYVAELEDATLNRIAARFINRIPLPEKGFTDYKSILERPPLPLVAVGLEGAQITDFLRRHVLNGLDGGYTATLTIGTVLPLPGQQVNALLVDIDVFKTCHIAPSFSAVSIELGKIRTIKNALFFGSVQESALEPYL